MSNIPSPPGIGHVPCLGIFRGFCSRMLQLGNINCSLPAPKTCSVLREISAKCAEHPSICQNPHDRPLPACPDHETGSGAAARSGWRNSVSRVSTVMMPSSARSCATRVRNGASRSLRKRRRTWTASAGPWGFRCPARTAGSNEADGSSLKRSEM